MHCKFKKARFDMKEFEEMSKVISEFFNALDNMLEYDESIDVNSVEELVERVTDICENDYEDK